MVLIKILINRFFVFALFSSIFIGTVFFYSLNVNEFVGIIDEMDADDSEFFIRGESTRKSIEDVFNSFSGIEAPPDYCSKNKAGETLLIYLVKLSDGYIGSSFFLLSKDGFLVDAYTICIEKEET